MQPQRPAMRLQDRLGKWARETFTPQGRAEVLAQKQIDKVLSQVSEEDREKAAELLESKRPEFIEASLPNAKRALVRDGIISAVVAGGVGVGIWKRKEISGLITKGTEAVGKRMPSGLKKAGEGIASRIRSMRKALRGERKLDMSSLMDALSGAIKLDELDVLDTASPVAEVFRGGRTPLMANSELQNMQAEHLVDNLVDAAQKHKRWVPLVIEKGKEVYDLVTPEGHRAEGMGLLLKNGLVKMKELSTGTKLFVPTEKFVDFLKRHIH